MERTSHKSRTHFDDGPDEAKAYLEECSEHPGLLDSLTSKELGYLGESLAASYLEDRGLDVLEHGYRCREGEADLVAYDQDRDEVVLVEVKTRRVRESSIEIYPEEAVDTKKRLRYSRIASCYIMEHYPVCALRFDIVAVKLISGSGAEIEHIFSAFEWDAA